MATDSLPAEAELSQAETNAGVARATGVMALGNITSRVLGLAREIALTNLFGATRAVDAFNVAIIVPKALYDLLIGGHVNSALIPVLSEVAAREGRDALWRLVSVLLSLVAVALALMVLVIELFAPQIVRLVGGGFDPATWRLATDLLRLTAPALVFLGLFAVLSGTLYALREFTWPAFAVAVFNGAIVITMLVFAPPLQIQPVIGPNLSIQWLIARPAEGIVAATIGWLVGSLAQLALQLPGMRGARVHLTLRWNHPAIRQIALLYAPVMFSLILDTLVIRTFSYNLASQTGEGSIGYMNWATTLIQFPQGLVATAISIAILPTLARQAALVNLEGDRAFKDTLGLGLRLAITLILPAAVGLFALATPIVALLFQHGAFTAHDTAMTALALRLYLVGLPFAAVDLLLVYAFYARQDTLTPALVGLLSLMVYMLAALALFPRYGLFSLMIADSVKHIVHALVSAFLLVRRMRGLGHQRLWRTILKTGLASGVMGLAAAAVLPLVERTLGAATLLHEMALVSVAGGVSFIVFLGLSALLRIEELYWLAGLMKRRLKRN
ncbi:MAG: murein biosynthesis integral membrane protein MurJ [Chloroflexi bacterium]|nr:murein biosynthesis integral membrane protein MurJ [Chloroflexota bacterium]MDL1883572.1 murein biosynthesis integral membrane protein MurJ [Anaerolineae bacterium CFX8]GIL12613.1 MAG: putative lipid II flippase MurJ [Chloroflexota bacterium]